MNNLDIKMSEKKLKFRVWDYGNDSTSKECQEEPKMFNPDSIVCIYNSKSVEVGDGLTVKKLRASERKFDLMQFTGFKDKNDKEIYENDIVKFKDGRIGVVIFDTLPLYIENQGKYYVTGWFINFKNEEYEPLEDDAEVIGNIYENPELLEGDINDYFPL